MKYFRIISFVFCLILLSDSNAQSKSDFYTDSLYVVWGKSNYSGKKDCSADVKISSDGNNIHITVNVTDDLLVFNDDQIHSDHVEIWFSLPDVLNKYDLFETLESNKFIISESAIYLIKGIPDLQKFKSFLKDPLINARDAGIDSIYYSQLDEWDDYGDWLKNKVKSFLPEPGSNLQVNNFPFGVVHFGLLPEKASAVQYDRELYSPIEKFTDSKLDELSKYINVSSIITKQGYTLDIILKPEALGFISTAVISRLKFLVDVVDVDTKNRQETLLSTSKNRKWSEPFTFNELKLGKHINVDIFNELSLLDTTESKNASFDKVKGRMSKYFMKTLDGWTPADVEYIQFYQYNQPEVYLMESITKYEVRKGVFKYRHEYIKNNLLEYFEFSDGKYVLLNKELLLDENNIIKPVILPNGKLSFLYSEYEITGRYITQIKSDLFLINENSKQKIACYFEQSPPIVEIEYLNISIREGWDYNRLDRYKYSSKNVPWINVIEYNENDQHLELKLGNNHDYTISWDEEGQLIK